MEFPTPPHSQLRVLIIMPLRDDWTSAVELIRRIDRSISSVPHRVEIVLVDDGSVEMCERSIFPSSLSSVRAKRSGVKG